MNSETLARTLEEFLSEASGAVVLEDGAVTFDLAQAKYSISGEHHKCLLHLWSAERNTVRRVLEAEVKSGTGDRRRQSGRRERRTRRSCGGPSNATSRDLL